VILRYRRREARPAVQLRWGGWSPACGLDSASTDSLGA
jgi:hypothetical protein